MASHPCRHVSGVLEMTVPKRNALSRNPFDYQKAAGYRAVAKKRVKLGFKKLMTHWRSASSKPPMRHFDVVD